MNSQCGVPIDIDGSSNNTDLSGEYVLSILLSYQSGTVFTAVEFIIIIVYV